MGVKLKITQLSLMKYDKFDEHGDTWGEITII